MITLHDFNGVELTSNSVVRWNDPAIDDYAPADRERVKNRLFHIVDLQEVREKLQDELAMCGADIDNFDDLDYDFRDDIMLTIEDEDGTEAEVLLGEIYVVDGVTFQRKVSYAELVELESTFDKQCEEKGRKFDGEEERNEALTDFIQQYIDGDNNPQI